MSNTTTNVAIIRKIFDQICVEMHKRRHSRIIQPNSLGLE